MEGLKDKLTNDKKMGIMDTEISTTNNRSGCEREEALQADLFACESNDENNDNCEQPHETVLLRMNLKL